MACALGIEQNCSECRMCGNGKVGKNMTNFERIKNFDKEEMLDFLCSIQTYDEGSVKTIENGVAMCSVTDVEEWLESECDANC